MFAKLLIANRGEIACRVMATARRLGIATVAVYSEVDAAARHVALADEAWPIGPAPATQSYLSIGRILDAARGTGAEAIHPGYGFLSENAEFADSCAAAGVVFVGPPASAIRAMGSKAAAKALMQRAGVPLVPGYHGEDQDDALLAGEAARLGFPVLIKASAGGGGKGMRVVESAEAFATALGAARREAMASFGDDRVLIERYLARPRHIEVQVFADAQGRVVHLFERDCSIQRRHQKIIEEAPAPRLDAARREAMGAAAIAAARAVSYVGAGTVEFIAEGDAFYFMEMNTRLQVEHPVTEAITGQDLVEWQLRVAAGEPLPRRQDELRIDGHAIEARLYAEDPARDFLPSTGTLTRFRMPRAGARVDRGVRRGDRVTSFYDPMLAKIVAHGATRAEAVRRLAAALAACEVAGVRTNLDLLRAIADHPAFAAADLATSFIAEHPETLAAPPLLADDADAVWAAAALAECAALRDEARAGGPASPWDECDAWTIGDDRFQDVWFRHEAKDEADAAARAVRLHFAPGDVTRLDLPGGRSVAAWLRQDRRGARLSVDGVVRRVAIVREAARVTVVLRGRNHVLHRVDPTAPPAAAAAAQGRVTAPIPARVTRVLAAPGDKVAKGAPLLVLEAMKTELTLCAPADGVVETVRPRVGDMVDEGVPLVTFVP